MAFFSSYLLVLCRRSGLGCLGFWRFHLPGVSFFPGSLFLSGFYGVSFGVLSFYLGWVSVFMILWWDLKWSLACMEFGSLKCGVERVFRSCWVRVLVYCIEGSSGLTFLVVAFSNFNGDR